MEIPKSVKNMLNKRERLAYELNEVCNKLDAWLEENGADLTDSRLVDCTITGCMIYCEPNNAKLAVASYIEEAL